MSYQELKNSDSGDDNVDYGDRAYSRRRAALFWNVLPWSFTVLLMTLNLALILPTAKSHLASLSTGTFVGGYLTDFEPARKNIEVERKAFVGGIAFDENGDGYFKSQDPIRYTGNPLEYPEIDANWFSLTHGRYILITEDEARNAFGQDIQRYWDDQRGGYVAGLDMFHTLHCLNHIRMSLNRHTYGSPDSDHDHDHDHRSPASSDLLHEQHCIEQLRQYIMCSGDMTPIPTLYYPSINATYIDSDVTHTCRNFEKLHQWSIDRYEGPGAVKPVL